MANSWRPSLGPESSGDLPWFPNAIAVFLASSWLALIASATRRWPSIHTYHESAGANHRCDHARAGGDQNDLACGRVNSCSIRYHDGADPSLYLRLVGFPGQVTIAPGKSLQVTTGAPRSWWNASPSLDAKTQALPANVGQLPV